jgi:putative transposase
MREQTGISQRRACLLVKLSRRVLNYTSKVRPENGQLQS